MGQDLGGRRGLKGFKIQAQKLLMAAMDPQFHRGWPLNHPMGLNARRETARVEHGAGFILAPTAHQGAVGAQGDGVAGHVGAAAQPVVAGVDVDNGHRRFRRDPMARPRPIAVEHHVADHQESGAGERRENHESGSKMRVNENRRRGILAPLTTFGECTR